MVVTADKLRMSDDERLQAVDGLYLQMQEKLLFLRSFNKETSVLALQRVKETVDVHALRNLQELKN